MNTELPQTICKSCGKPIRGRSDKKFCNDYCRHVHHNKFRAEDEGPLQRINTSLRRNRRIIKEAIEPENEPLKIRREDLLNRGFVFKYHTHEKRNRSGSVYTFCYEYGYLPLENEYYLLVKED